MSNKNAPRKNARKTAPEDVVTADVEHDGPIWTPEQVRANAEAIVRRDRREKIRRAVAAALHRILDELLALDSYLGEKEIAAAFDADDLTHVAAKIDHAWHSLSDVYPLYPPAELAELLDDE